MENHGFDIEGKKELPPDLAKRQSPDEFPISKLPNELPLINIYESQPIKLPTTEDWGGYESFDVCRNDSYHEYFIGPNLDLKTKTHFPIVVGFRFREVEKWMINFSSKRKAYEFYRDLEQQLVQAVI